MVLENRVTFCDTADILLSFKSDVRKHFGFSIKHEDMRKEKR